MQPTYLPWLGYFDLIDRSDYFVFLDSVQFEKQSWQQRNRLKLNGELQWLSVPVLRSGHSTESIREIKVMHSASFPKKHISSIEQNYRRTPYFNQYFPALNEILASEKKSLASLNQRIILWMAHSMGLSSNFICSSDMRAIGRRSDLLVAICKEIGFLDYLSPLGSAAYIIEEYGIFEQSGIMVNFQHYEHPTYRQGSDPFLPFASALDLLFNEGDRSLEIIRSGRCSDYSLQQAASLTQHPL